MTARGLARELLTAEPQGWRGIVGRNSIGNIARIVQESLTTREQMSEEEEKEAEEETS